MAGSKQTPQPILPSNNTIIVSLLNTYQDKGATLTQLADLYKVDVRTFKKWIAGLKDLKTDESRIYTPSQVKKIIKHIDEP